MCHHYLSSAPILYLLNMSGHSLHCTMSKVQTDNDMCNDQHCRLESLNEKRSGVVQMVKLAEKERDSLEVLQYV